MKRFKVRKISKCEICKKRKTCSLFDKDNEDCISPMRHTSFAKDRIEEKRLKSLQMEDLDKYLSSLKYTDRKQIKVDRDFRTKYHPKPDSIRRFNSRSNTIIPVAGSEVDMIKFCENCGAKFHTVNAERRLCQKCHDEICEYLGVNYLFISKYRIKK